MNKARKAIAAGLIAGAMSTGAAGIAIGASTAIGAGTASASGLSDRPCQPRFACRDLKPNKYVPNLQGPGYNRPFG